MMNIAIANNSQELVDSLMRVLLKMPSCNFIWVGYDSVETLRKCKDNPPDIILLDVNLPGLGCVEITKSIMATCNSCILLTTSDISTNSEKIFESMCHGAADVAMLKLNFNEEHTLVENLMQKITFLEQFTKSDIKRKKLTSKENFLTHTFSGNQFPIIAIGASTGGPKAISSIISSFPANSKFSIVIIQHIDEKFIPSFVKWLNEFSQMPVVMAVPEMDLKPGVVYVGAKNSHLIVNDKKKFEYMKVNTADIYSPSIDVFFESLSKNWLEPSIAILLTGMGGDGAQGLKKLHDHKWITIVQSQSTCAVFGMPKMAIELGAVTEILNLKEIAPYILRYLGLKL